MIDAVLAKIFGTQNERDIKAIRPKIALINALEPELQKLSDIDLAAKTIEFKERLAQGAALDDLLVEAFALVREASRRGFPWLTASKLPDLLLFALQPRENGAPETFLRMFARRMAKRCLSWGRTWPRRSDVGSGLPCR